MKFDEVTEEEVLKKFRSEKGKPDTVGGFFYRALGNAAPSLVEAMEKSIVSALTVGANAGRVMRAAESDENFKQEFIRQMQEISKRDRTGSSKSTLDDEEKK